MSKPLNLWAPSSSEIRSGSARIPIRMFLKLLERGDIRIHAREEWILEPNLRGSPRWPFAGWDNEIDGEIRSLYLQDEMKPVEERRVIGAAPEKGYEWAENYLATRPAEVDRWMRIVRSRRASQLIPAGTLQPALSNGDPFLVVRRILRDAYNHGRAFADSNAEVPFLSPGTDRRFLDVLAKAPALDPFAGEEPTRRTQASMDARASDLSAQLLELIRFLSIHSQRCTDAEKLDKFVSSEGHRELAEWMSQLCILLRRTNPNDIDNFVLEQLEGRLRNARFTSPLRKVVQKKDEMSAGILGLMSTAVGLATEPVSLATAVGVAASIYPLGKGLARHLGFAPTEFDGPQWPFLYTYGSQATGRRLKRIERVLEELRTLRRGTR